MIPSINFIFYNSLLLEYNTNNFDDIKHLKISLRNTLKSLNKYGICSEEILPSNDLACNPYQDCYIFGKYFHFKYSRLSKNIDNIKRILNNNKFILCNLSIYTSFLKDKMSKEGILDYPDEYDSILGMFSGVIVGYTEKKFIVKSCFGEDWGDKGYFNIEYKYLNDLCNDLWLIEVFIDKKKKFGLNTDTNMNINMDNNINTNENKFKNIANQSEIRKKNNTEIKQKSDTDRKNSMMRGSVF